MGLFTGLVGTWPTELLCKAFLVVCGYKSFKAIESKETADDTQWLTFWMVMSLVQFAEFWTDVLRRWIPYYNEAKLGLVVWLGAMRGANMIYEKTLRPLLKQQEKLIDQHAGDALSKMNQK